MSPPSLLCLEETNTCFDYDDDGDNGIWEEEQKHQTHQTHHQNPTLFHDDLVQFPLLSDEDLILMFERELMHLPKEDYLKRLKNGELDSRIRSASIDWIIKVHSHYSFGPLSAYLSVNYLDRFLSVYDLPVIGGKSWMMQLLSVACLSIAAKMEETKMPLSLDLQVCEPGFIFEAKTIKKMELVVLSTLNWRMQSVTPFSYIDYFLTKANGGSPPSKYLISQSSELILSTLRGIDFLEFKPSEFAAAGAIYVSRETLTSKELEKSDSCVHEHINKERLVKCLKMIEEMASISECLGTESSSLPSIPHSPNGVLDAAGYKSDESIDRSNENFSHTKQGFKRRKLN